MPDERTSPDQTEDAEQRQGEQGQVPDAACQGEILDVACQGEVPDAACQGQAYLEFIIVLPLLIILFYFVGVQAWWWWNQTTAAVAIHDGTAAMGHHGGTLAEGNAEVREALTAALGGVAGEYAGTYQLSELPAMRATMGHIRNDTVVTIPYVGSEVFTVEARSFQRAERFYGGPPSYFE